ncbi:hypothetical protein MKX03_019405 [Papaver bracteatum]|nr:hypothetical protein MKX03_019405 [Papaver bracteatum]
MSDPNNADPNPAQGNYQGPPVMAPPQYPAAPPQQPAKAQPLIFEILFGDGCLDACCCCCCLIC